MTAGPCTKCGGAMSEGFIVDNTHGGQTVSNWIEGAPQKSFWLGIKTSGKTTHEVETWRCNRCGFLENYAPG